MEYLVRNKNEFQLTQEVSKELAEFERLAKEIKAKQDAIKVRILKEMEEAGIVKIDTEELTISYVAQTTRESFDAKKLRADQPDIYDEYVKISPVKASIRIKVKEV